MPVDLSGEFEAPSGADLGAEFDPPARVDLAGEFTAPGALPSSSPTPKPTLRELVPTMLAGMSGQFQMPPGTTMEDIQAAAPEVLDAVKSATPTALRVGVPLAVAPFTGGLSVLPAAAALGGASLAGELAAEGVEIASGERERISPGESAVATLAGAAGPALRAVPALKPLLAPGPRELVTRSIVPRLAAQAVEGAVMTAAADTGTKLVRGEEVSAGSVLGSAALGTGLALGLGYVFDDVARQMTLDRMFTRARGLGFKGESVDDMRAWWSVADAQAAQNARATARTERNVTPQPGAATEPVAPAPGSARTEFEARAGMAPPPARPDPTPPAPAPGPVTPARPAAATGAEPVEHAPWETEGGQPATGEREDGASEWARPPSPEAQAIIATGREPTSALNPAAHPVVEFPVADIVVNKDIRQFKENGDAASGVVEPLGGRFERLGTAPITLWQKANGEVEVITGRHRLDLARRSGERTIPAQVVREKDGFTKLQALTFDAESNIRDGQGTVKDYAGYFRARPDITEADAVGRGLLARARGGAGWSLGRHAGDDLFSLYANGQIAEGKAVAIARGAPNHAAAQASAMRAAPGKTAGELEVFARNLSRLAPDADAAAARQMGFDGISTDFAAYEETAAKLAAVQAERIKANAELIAAARGAAKNPGAAARMGLPVKDPEALRARIEALDAENIRLRNPDEAMWAELHTAAGLPPPRRAQATTQDDASTTPPTGDDPNTMAMFEGGDYRGDGLAPARRAQVDAVAAARVDALRAQGREAMVARGKSLRALSRERALSAAEGAELDALDAALGQQALAFPPPAPSAMRANVQAGYDLARAEMEARARTPLRGADVETQARLFDEPGQLALFERRGHSYDDPKQLGLDLGRDIFGLVHPPALPSAKAALGGAGGQSGQGTLSLATAGDSPLFGGGAGPGSDGAGGLSGRPSPAKIEMQGRAFARALIGDGKIDFVGREIRSAEDFARLAQVLRNPRFETFYLVAMRAGRVVGNYAVTSRIPFSASVFAPGETIETYRKLLADTQADGYWLAHNHPSTNIEPSSPDRITTAKFAQQLPGMLGHVIIDHGQYAVITAQPGEFGAYQTTTDYGMLPDVAATYDPLMRPDQPHPALGELARPSDHAAIVSHARALNSPEAVTLFFVNSQSRVTGVAQMLDVSAEGMAREPLMVALREAARDVGASGAIAYYEGGNGYVRHRLVQLARASVLLDANFGGSGLIEQGLAGGDHRRLWQEEQAMRVQEDMAAEDAAAGLPPFDPERPLLVRDGRRGAYWQVPLERVAGIPIVQMPELVKLTRMLTGQLPLVRKLRRSMGTFQGAGAGEIVIDPRVFRDPTVAAKVLAHEIGHLGDWLSDRTLARGNLLGRIGSLRNYLLTSMPLDPLKGGKALTAADRRSIRAEAEKRIGKRPPADEPDERAAWGEAVAAKYAELVQDELEARGLIVERATTRGGTTMVGAGKSGVGIREELIGVSIYWKPIPDDAPPGYVAYRMSGVELYADALSVLLNSPGTLKRLAPTFYEAFFNHLDAKPEFKSALFDIYDMLNKPHLVTLRRRSDDIRGMFIKGDEIILRKAAEREARYASMRGWWDRFRQELFDTFDPLVSRGAKLERKGVKIPDRYNPRYLFDEHPLGDNRNYEMVQRLWEKVVKPVEAAQYTLNELGEYLFLQRVLNEHIVKADPPPSVVANWRAARLAAAKITDPALRAKATQDLDRKLSEWNMSQNVGRTGVANPLGTTPETARLGLLRMRIEGGARFAELERAAKVFHDTVFEQMQAATDAGIYSRELFDAVLKPNRDYYAAFGVLDYLEDYVPATVRASEGTFKEIANPFTATVLKMVSVNRLIQTQKSKQGTVEFLRRFDPANITPAPTRFDGRRMIVEAPTDPDKGLLQLLDNGTPVGWHVDANVAEMFDKLTPAHVSAVLRVLNWPFRNLIYPLIIKYNPAFQLVLGPARDLRRTLVNVPRGKGLRQVGELARNYTAFLGLPPTEAGAAVRAYLRGEPHPLIAEMIATQAIGTPLDNFARDFGRADPMQKILADYGLAPDKKRGEILGAIRKPVMWLLERIEFAGLTFEMLPKVSTYKMLTSELGWSRKEAAYFVRNSVGVPNIHRKGKHTMVAEVIYPFAKVFINGLRSDARLARGPKTAGGWWFRWAASDGLWTMLQAAAALGLLGAGIKELFDGISDYNKTNYNVLPIGTTEGGEFGKRVLYIRLPRDETHRLVSGMLYQGMMLMGGEAGPEGTSSLLAFGSDQVPGLNPLLEIAGAWKDYLEGENPKDSFRGSPILSNAEWLAGGTAGLGSMVGFTADNMGVTNFVRYDPKANTTAEMTLSAVPGLNRFIQSSATGYRERQEKAEREESAARARIRLAMPENVQRLSGEYYHLRSVSAELRTEQQTMRLEELARWRKQVYQDYEDAASAGMMSDEMKRLLTEESAPYERGGGR